MAAVAAVVVVAAALVDVVAPLVLVDSLLLAAVLEPPSPAQPATKMAAPRPPRRPSTSRHVRGDFSNSLTVPSVISLTA